MNRLAAVLPRLVAIVLGCLLLSAAVTFAADSGPPPPAPLPTPAASAGPSVLVVPDVRSQAYVFAKGTLEDAGFAWKVTGPVEGYAANVVGGQAPAPGTRVVDTGAPLVTLVLQRNPSYAEQGEPENAAPFPATSLEIAGAPGLAEAAAPAAEPAAPAPAAKPKPAAKAKAKPKPAAKRKAKPASPRPPAFAVPGAPAEPLDELALPERARRLAAYVRANPKPTDAVVKHWLYQHTWIVTGARFGWHGGAEALALLVEVDRQVQRQWGIGGKSLAVARAALAEVRAKS